MQKYLITLLLAFALIAGCGQPSNAAVLVQSTNGTYVTKTSLTDANTAADAAGKRIKLTGAIALTSNITLATDRQWDFTDTVITTTGYTLTCTGADILFPESKQIFTGSGTVTGLDEYKPEWFGAKGDGLTDDSSAITSACNNAKSNVNGSKVLFENVKYSVGNGVNVSGIGSNFHWQAGDQTEFISSGNGSSRIITLQDVASNCSFLGGRYYYSVAPTVRNKDAILISGAAIDNLDVKDVQILNSANFGVFILGQGGNSSACHDVRVHNIYAINTLGDGVHIENIASNVSISGVYGRQNGDDMVSVVAYNGATGSGNVQRTVPIENISIDNIEAVNHTLGVLKLQGVRGATVNNISSVGAKPSLSSVVNIGGQLNYSVDTSNITVSNIAAYGSDFGIYINNYGSQAVKDVKINNFTIANTYRPVFVIGQASNKISNLQMSQGYLNDNPASTANGLDITYTASLYLSDLGSYQNNRGYVVANSENVFVDRLRVVDVGDGLRITGCTNASIGKLDFTTSVGTAGTGVYANSNTTIKARGLWSIAGTFASAVGGTNTSPEGFYDEISGVANTGAVTASTESTINYSRALMVGGTVQLLATAASTASVPWVSNSVTGSSFHVLWGGTATSTAVHYTARMLLN